MAEKKRIMTDETGKEIAAAIKKLSSGEKPAIEYGVRFPIGSSSPIGERVIRQNGVISRWDITFTQNINNNNGFCPFADIDLFAPETWTDAAGNVFKRFRRFYYLKESTNIYDYIWVCEEKANNQYKLPKAFDGWNYVDIGVYEGGTETIDGTTYLCSKTGKSTTRSKTRTQFVQHAQNWHTKLDVNTDQEFYCITTMSEITEIIQPLLYIQLASKNSDAGYKGYTDKSGATESNLKTTGETDGISGLHGTTSDDGLHSFKMLGIENIWGHMWTQIMDCTLYDYVPYVCRDLKNWEETSTPHTDEKFEAANYSVATSGGNYVKRMGYDTDNPDIVLPVEVGNGASDSTYHADYYWVGSGAKTVYFGGLLDAGRICGVSYWRLSNAVGYSAWYSGARLSHRSL